MTDNYAVLDNEAATSGTAAAENADIVDDEHCLTVGHYAADLRGLSCKSHSRA